MVAVEACGGGELGEKSGRDGQGECSGHGGGAELEVPGILRWGRRWVR